MGPPGDAGPAGPQGPSGIVNVYGVYCDLDTIAAQTIGTPTWGNGSTAASAKTPSLSLVAGQKVIASGTAVLGPPNGAQVLSVDAHPCFQMDGGTTWTPFLPAAYPTFVVPEILPVSMNAMLPVTAPGTYVFSFCYRNKSANTNSLNRNDYMNGWFMIAN